MFFMAVVVMMNIGANDCQNNQAPVPSPLPQPLMTMLAGNDMEVRGNDCPVTSTFVEASWNGGPWIYVGSCTLGEYEGFLPPQGAGHGILAIRDNTGQILRTTLSVGWGLPIEITGQSNATGLMETLINAISSLASVFMVGHQNEAESIKHADDRFTDHGNGSAWPLLADEIIGQTGLPVMFISSPVGATSVSQWVPGGNLRERAKDLRMTATNDCSAADIFYQGENEPVFASNPTIDPETGLTFGELWLASIGGDLKQYYKGELFKIADDHMNAGCGGTPLVIVQIGDNTANQNPGIQGFIQEVRDAQYEAAIEHPNIHLGACTAGLPVPDGLHLGDDAREEFVSRLMKGLAPVLWGGPVPTDEELGCTPPQV